MAEEELRTHRNAMLNICFLLLCLLLAWLALLVTIIYVGENHSISISGITTTNTYPEGEVVTFLMEIGKFEARYCYPGGLNPSICGIVPNLASAEDCYMLFLAFSLAIICYNMLNLWFTAFSEKVPRFFNCYYVHFLNPITSALGFILYFTVSKAFAVDDEIHFAYGFYLMISVIIISLFSAIFNKRTLNTFVKTEETEPLLS